MSSASEKEFSSGWHKFFDKPVPNMTLRILVMLVGLSLSAFSVALSRATGLGTSPISCVPASLSFLTSLTIGGWTFIMNAVFITCQIILLRKRFNWLQLLQLPFVAVFSVLIDLFVPVANAIPMNNYLVQLVFTILGSIIAAAGIVLQVKCALIMLSADALVVTISRVFRFEFSKCKVAFDCTLVVTAVAISLIGSGQLLGVREGTIIFALTTGLWTKFFYWLFRHFDRYVPVTGHISLLPEEQGKTAPVAVKEGEAAPLVITIAREYGSGGREIGGAIAERLGIKVYDRSLVDMVAQENGLTTEFVKNHEEEVRRGILYSLFAQTYQHIGAKPADVDALFLAQARTITRLADSESCVVVGRNANYILQAHPNCFNVFVHAPLEDRIARVMARDQISRDKAVADIRRVDEERAEHARRYTGHRRGVASSYHLAIDSSLTTADEVARIVEDLVGDRAAEA